MKEELARKLSILLLEKQPVLAAPVPARYYNGALGDVSSLLAALLQALLKEQSDEWLGANNIHCTANAMKNRPTRSTGACS